MRRPRALLFAAAGAALVLAAPASAATSLDGVRRTEHSYSGDLTQAVGVAASVQPTDPSGPLLTPSREDCGPDSCHFTELILQLPRDRQSGELSFQVRTHPAGAQAPEGYADPVAYGVYDAKGTEVGYWTPCCTAPSLDRPPGTRPSTASKPIVASRLKAGRYTLVIYNLAGPTSFAATVSWRANKSHRPTP